MEPTAIIVATITTTGSRRMIEGIFTEKSLL